MKELYFSLLVTVLLSAGCSAYLPSSLLATTPVSSLSDLPLKPHTREVQVFFDIEKPAEPYYKVKLVETKAAPGTSMDAMLVQLKQKARAEGVDALLISDFGKQVNMVADGEYKWKQLVAVGLRYKRTIDYIDTILRDLELSWWNDDNSAPKQFRIQYDMHGRVLSLGDSFTNRFYMELLYPYEAFAIGFGPIDGWDYKLDSNGFLLSKRRLGNGVVAMKCNYHYQDGLFQKAEIIIPAPTDGGSGRQKYLLVPEYNSNGVLSSRRLWNGKTLVWTDRFSYRLNGMPDKMTRHELVQEKPVKVLEMRFNYYSAEDLPPAQR